MYCNCDGPESEIYRLLKARYGLLGLRRLVATKYAKGGRGLKTEFDGNDEEISELDGDGSFDSAECVGILRGCDVVVTNPPFTRQADLIELILGEGKDLHLFASPVGMYSGRIRPYILGGKLFAKNIFPGGGKFLRPSGNIAAVCVYVVSTLARFTHTCCQKTMRQL